MDSLLWNDILMNWLSLFNIMWNPSSDIEKQREHHRNIIDTTNGDPYKIIMSNWISCVVWCNVKFNYSL